MSITVKCLYKAKTCHECHFLHTENFRHWCCITEREDIYFDGVPEWCPVSEDNWTSTKKGNPEYDGRFLCRYKMYEYDEIGHCTDFGRYDSDYGWSTSGVTHWMQLPDEPEEENSEE